MSVLIMFSVVPASTWVNITPKAWNIFILSPSPGHDNLNDLPAFAECPVRKDGDECEKGIHRSSPLPEALPAYPKGFDEGRFGEYVSVGGYASPGIAEDVKMPRAEARGDSLF